MYEVVLQYFLLTLAACTFNNIAMTVKERQALMASKRRKQLTYRELGKMVGVTGTYVELLLSGRQPSPRYKTVVIDKLKKVLL
jgi:cyanate lyase|tara:strand:+ start:46 stop:294 length:249 start_codon:yes stop_codon:yes gene_type:complete